MMNYWINRKMSFETFCEELQVMHPKKGFVPFELYDYQKRLVDLYDNERYVIVKKFRQGGFTTLTALYLFYKCLTQYDTDAAVVSRTLRESWAVGDIVKRALDYFTIDTDRRTNSEIVLKNGSRMCFINLEGVRGRKLDYVLLDEPAFWKIIYPCFSHGGKCFVVSTPNGAGNWFYKLYQNAVKGKNDFKIFECHYKEHPDYENESWLARIRDILGPKAFHQEVLTEFLEVE